MQLKRYSTEELQKLCTDIFYDYMSSVDSNSHDTPTPTHQTHAEYENKLNEYKERIGIYYDALNKESDETVKSSLHKQLAYLEQGVKHLVNSNMKYQKKLYAETKSTDYCRTIVQIPLDKRINSYYDDFTLEVALYDDVCTLNGKFEEFKTLKTSNDRLEFLKENTKITHMSLVWLREGRRICMIALEGKLNTSNPRVTESEVTMLDQKFSDFDKLTLKDINSIDNNDLKQFLQDKIDLDKENMEELSSLLIRGDVYSIYKSHPDKNRTSDFYIRYTCRSTGRVYYNMLNLNNLKLSSYFKEDDYDSYSKAWWNLNTLGGNPDDNRPVVRC
jgi:hypothetical protein